VPSAGKLINSAKPVTMAKRWQKMLTMPRGKTLQRVSKNDALSAKRGKMRGNLS